MRFVTNDLLYSVANLFYAFVASYFLWSQYKGQALAADSGPFYQLVPPQLYRPYKCVEWNFKINSTGLQPAIDSLVYAAD